MAGVASAHVRNLNKDDNFWQCIDDTNDTHMIWKTKKGIFCDLVAFNN